MCPYHGWTFGDDGRCVRVPSAADHVPPPPRAHLSTFGCTERYGLVWLCLGDTSPDGPDGIPVIVHENDPSFRRINTPVDVWQTSCTRMTDNFLDITHFPFVHVGTFGRSQDTQVPKFEMEPTRQRLARVLATRSARTTTISARWPVVRRRVWSSGR